MDTKKYSAAHGKTLKDLISLEEAWLGICTSGLTAAEIALLDAGRSNPSVEAYTRTASKVFLMTMQWALVQFAAPAVETDSVEEIGRQLLRRMTTMQDQHAALLQTLRESVVEHPTRH